MKIDLFRGKYNFLSNFYEAPVEVYGLKYLNSEAAFQAQKTLNFAMKQKFTTMNPTEAKRMGKMVILRDDWEDVKVQIMEDVVRAKFSQNPELAQKLIETGDVYLEEGNTWGDRTWGTVNGSGSNLLGQILMKIRDELQNEITNNRDDILNSIAEDICIDFERDFEATDTEGWNLEGKVEYNGQEYFVELFGYNEDSYELQAAKQIYKQITKETELDYC